MFSRSLRFRSLITPLGTSRRLYTCSARRVMPEPLSGVPSDSTPTDTQTPALPELCAQISRKVHAFLDSPPQTERVRSVQQQSRTSLGILEEALDRYSLDELSLSYNGGKDCLVLLILFLSALHTKLRPDSFPPTLQSVYIIPPNSFPEVDTFVTASSATYHLTLTRSTLPMKEAFAAYLDSQPHIRAIFVGTRRTDPHGAKLKHFDPTDRGWPEFMRIHPVIDWHYADIWTFIREMGTEYCGLYDMGYTSLGGTEDTWPNPALKDGEGRFRPAYELVADEEERLGRR